MLDSKACFAENCIMNSTNAPVVSVLMPCFNATRYLQAAIESILNQTFTDFELIIIDDCSDDSPIGIINRYRRADERIIYLRNDRNLGVSESLTGELSWQRAN